MTDPLTSEPAGVALVTGAGGDISRAVAQRLSGEGFRVALNARIAEDIVATAAVCAGEVMSVPADIKDPAAADTILGNIEKQWGRVDVLIVNAGAGIAAPVDEVGDEEWDWTLDLNLSAPFRLLRRAVGPMRRAGYGRIVVVASVAARVGEPGLAAYAAAKHGVLGLVRSVAAELAPSGVTVNAVLPGRVDPPARPPGGARPARPVLPFLGGVGEGRRPITPADVAEAVSFCVRMPAMTGQGIVVDGGAVQA